MATQTQSGIVLMSVLLMLLLVPAVVMLVQQQSSAFSISLNSSGQNVELQHVLNAATAHARYLADQNSACSNFDDLPLTDFGAHQYSAAISQDPDLPRLLSIKVAATLDDGTSATRTVRHTAYQPSASGSLTVRHDTTVDSSNPSDGYATENYFRVGNDGSDLRYGLLDFPLSGVIPPATRIESAELSLHVESVNPPVLVATPDLLTVHAMGGRKWLENATWDLRDGNKSWRPDNGAEPIFSVLPIATLSAAPIDSVSIDVTSFIRKVMKSQLAFNGFLLQTSVAPLSVEFSSREADNFQHHPKLDVTYHCPCAIDCLIYPRLNYHDELEAIVDPDTFTRTCDPDQDYRGSQGDNRWTFNAWQEIGDDADPCTGSIRLDQDPQRSVPDSYQLKFSGHETRLQRATWLENAEEVAVSFSYRREGLTDTDQRLLLQASDGNQFDTLLEIEGGVTDAEYQDVSFLVPQSYIGAETVFALFTENLNEAQHFYVDRFTVSFLGDLDTPQILSVVADSYLNEDDPDKTFIGLNELRLKDQVSENMRIIAAVSTGGLLEDEIVSSAKLRFWIKDNRTDRETTLRIYPLDESWDWGSVTWNDREKDVAAWAVPGGTFTVPANPLDTPTLVLPPGEKEIWAEFDITPYVQAWADFPSTNNGLLLTVDDTGRGKDLKISSMEDGNKALRPHVELQ